MCGVKHKAAVALQKKLSCKTKDGTRMKIRRKLIQTYDAKRAVQGGVDSAFQGISGISRMLGISSETMPSQECCAKAPDKADGTSVSHMVWTKTMVRNCCGAKGPKSKCIEGKPETCLPLVATEEFETDRDKTRVLNTKKCRARTPSKLSSSLALGEGHKFFFKNIKSAVSKVSKATKFVTSKAGSALKSVTSKAGSALQSGAKQMAITGFLKLARRFIPAKIYPLAKAVALKLVDGDIRGAAMEIMPRIKTLVIEPLLYSKTKFSMRYVECKIREYALPTLDSNYRIRVEGSNFERYSVVHQKVLGGKAMQGPGCERNRPSSSGPAACRSTKSENAKFSVHDIPCEGPLRLRIVRDYVKPDGTIDEAVCHFEYEFDMHGCEIDLKKFPETCGAPWAWEWPRTTNSVYNEKAQTNPKEHQCKPWYIGVNSLVQAGVAVMATYRFNMQLAPCM
jgi:hypothetical protein